MLIRQKEESKQLAKAREEVKSAIQGSLTAEEQFVKATARAHELRRMGAADADQETRLIKSAQEKLLASWKSEATPLPGMAMRDSQEAYRFSMEDRNRATSDAANQLRLTQLQLKAQQEANAALEAIQKNTAKPSSVATM